MNARALVETIKGFEQDRLEMPELMATSMLAQGLREQYEQKSVTVPGWLHEQIDAINGEITRHNRDDLTRQLRELEGAEAGLLTNAEKREKVAAQKARVLAALGQRTETPVGA